MSDSFEFTLHSPLTKEDWDKISDVEHENTRCVTFQTPQGKQVKYIRSDVLDEISTEIEQNAYPIVYGVNNHEMGMTLYGILQVIDKYKAESEGKNEI